jgi:murein DD-endopeptidase MepM/ murein hydrolase activator NlpD
MAILNKSSGSLFPLISDIKNNNAKNESPEPKLKRSAGPKQDVRIGDGMTVILSKIWGALKKQEDFTKVVKKNIETDKKFKKESKDLMKKNHQVILNSLNVLNKDVTKVLSKILDVNEKSAKEETKRLDEAERTDELKQDFAKETFRENNSESERRHKELLDALGKMSGGEGKTKRQRKNPFEKLIDDLKKDMMGFSEGLLAGVFGRSIAKFFVSTLPGLISTSVASAIRLVLANPLAALAVAMSGLSAYMAKDFSDKEKDLNAAAKKGDVKSMREEAERQADMIRDQGGTGIGANDIIKDRLRKANTTESQKALKQLEQQEKDEAFAVQHGPKSSSMIIQTVKGKVDNGNRTQEFPGNFTLPVKEGVLSSAKKENRTIKGVTKDHNGVDIAVPYGSPVNPIADGEILQVGQDAASGKYVRVKHRGGMVSSYAHLSAINDKLKVGQTVTTETEIAKSGGEGKDAGRSTGAHLHLGLKDASGQWVDPQRYIPELSGVQEKTKVAKGESGTGTALAAAAAPDSGGMVADAGNLSNMIPDLNTSIADALGNADRIFKGSASMFQDTSIKTSQADPLNKMNESIRTALLNNNNTPPITNIVNNSIASAGGSSEKSGQYMSPRSKDSSLERAQYGMLRPVTGFA